MRLLTILSLLFFSSLFGDVTYLKESDIKKIMNQIFKEHLEKKEMSAQILKTSFRIFLEQFDPDRIYLFQREVDPVLQMPFEELKNLAQQYKKGDYSYFTQLNDLVQNAARRAEGFRSEHKDLFFKWVDSVFKREPFDDQTPPGYAKNMDELTKRIEQDFKSFVQDEMRHLGQAAWEAHKEGLVQKYDQSMKDREYPYLYLNEQGQPLTPSLKENLYALHILKSLAASLDSHTKIYNPAEAYEMKVRLEKEFQGVGLVLEEAGPNVKVVEIMEGSPAAKSGVLKVGDLILSVNGELTEGMTFSQVIQLIHTQPGNEIKFRIMRDDKFLEVELKKDKILVNNNRVSVFSEPFENGVIAVLKLDSFYQGEGGVSSEQDLKDAIDKLDQKHLKGIVIDLRNNSGGFLTQAVKVVGLFITNGIAVISKYSSGEEHIYRDMNNEVAFDGPVVILVSKLTASAAEIVAQALQDYGVAVIVGDEHTYGKGTIQSQTVTDGKEGPSYFKVTVGKYYTVSGKTPQLQGVKSDILVPGPLSNQEIGEEYLENAVQTDSIPPTFNDTLKDIDPTLKDWYMKYYIPFLQKRSLEWKPLLPELKSASVRRLQKNPAFQAYQKRLNGQPVSHQEAEAIQNTTLSDLQEKEALNILKDMIRLEDAQQLRQRGKQGVGKP